MFKFDWHFKTAFNHALINHAYPEHQREPDGKNL
jgi:hypothetical protein